MCALQLYIRFLPNFHSPFQEPTASILQTVFSRRISVPPPTSWLSLGHFSSRAPGAPFSHTMPRYARALSHLSNICSYLVFSSDIVHFGYLVVLCAGTWSSSLHIIPSGIYTQHWHVVSPAELHLHFQSYPLILAFRVPIPGSAVLTPLVASSILSPGSILTHMSCPIHSTFLHL